MSDNNAGVVLITNDSHLRDLVASRKPAGLTLRLIKPEELTIGQLPPAKQLWIDLDDFKTGSETAYKFASAGRRIFFHSEISPILRHSLIGLFLRKPCSPSMIDVLWADVAAETPEQPPRRPRTVTGHTIDLLPGWMVELQVLDLSTFCHRCIELLPANLGYSEIALYLHDQEQNILTLATTNAKRQIDLAVPLAPDSRHILAAATYARKVYCSDDLHRSCRQRNLFPPAGFDTERTYSTLIIPLCADGLVQGVIQLTREIATTEKAPAEPPPALIDFLGRCLRHARQYLQARIEARVDRLTGLYNYRWLMDALAKEIHRSQRHHSPLCLIMIDLDELKRVNDRFGHTAGDALIRHAARKIGAALRQIDSAARIGGDEFVVLLPATDLGGARHVADRILTAISNDAPVIQQEVLPVAVSLGVTQWRSGWDETHLLAAADQAMYAAKREGHNRMVCHPHEVDSPASAVPAAD